MFCFHQFRQFPPFSKLKHCVSLQVDKSLLLFCSVDTFYTVGGEESDVACLQRVVMGTVRWPALGFWLACQWGVINLTGNTKDKIKTHMPMKVLIHAAPQQTLTKECHVCVYFCLCTLQPWAETTLMSAGILSPPFTSIRSPATTSSALICTFSPSRITKACCTESSVWDVRACVCTSVTYRSIHHSLSTQFMIQTLLSFPTGLKISLLSLL